MTVRIRAHAVVFLRQGVHGREPPPDDGIHPPRPEVVLIEAGGALQLLAAELVGLQGAVRRGVHQRAARVIVVSLLHRTALVEHHADAAQVVFQVIVVDGGGVIGEGDVTLLGEQHRQLAVTVDRVAAVVGGDDVGAGYRIDYSRREAASLRLRHTSQRGGMEGTYDPLPPDRRAELVARRIVGVVDVCPHAVAQYDGFLRQI